MTRADLCGCMTCIGKRADEMVKNGASVWDVARGPMFPGWRYAREKCGNKRCPHLSNHELACTGSNNSGQEGSFYQ